jgi:hypothetical protein
MSRVKQNQKEMKGSKAMELKGGMAATGGGGGGGRVDAVSGPECQGLSAVLLYEFKERLSQKNSPKQLSYVATTNQYCHMRCLSTCSLDAR